MNSAFDPVVHLALLESFRESQHSDELDLFVPAVAVSIHENSGAEVTAENIQKSFERVFKSRPPLSVIESLLVRAKNRNLLRVENKVFIPNSQELQPIHESYNTKASELDVSFRAFRRDLKAFARERFKKEVSDEQCDTLVLEFIEKNVSSVAREDVFTKASLDDQIKNTDHLIAAFVSHIHRHKTNALDHFAAIAKGAILADYLQIAEQSGKKKRYNHLTVWLDTPIILGLLGYSGAQKEHALTDLLGLLGSFKIQVRCFDVSVDEAERLLRTWGDDLRHKRYEKFNSKTLELLRHKRIDSARLNTEAALLEKRIQELGIRIKKGFKIVEKWQCDYEGLDGKISTIYKHYDGSAKRHDLACISRVYMLRQGRHPSVLDQSRHVFITQNDKLRARVNDHFREEVGTRSIPLVMSERWLTTVFWVKSSSAFSALPKNQLLAAAYGLLYTDDKFWSNFVDRLECLKKQGQVSADDYALARWDSEALTLVHDKSVDVGYGISDDDVFELVSEIKRRAKEDEVEKVKRMEEAYFTELSNTRSELEKARGGVNKLSSIVGSVLASAVVFMLLIGLVLGTYWAAPEPKVQSETIPIYLMVYIAGFVVAAIFSVVGWWRGVTLRTIYRLIKRRTSDRVRKWLQN